MGPDEEQALTLRRAEQIQKHGNKKEKGAGEVLSGHFLIRVKVYWRRKITESCHPAGA